MADINEARQQMMDELQRKIQTDSKLSSIRNKIQNGDYSEASQYGMRSGEILSEVIRGNITEELFQQCDVKGLGEMLLPVIKQENQYVSNAVSAAQKAQNAEVGIGIKPLQAENDLNSYFNIFTKMKSDAYESFEQASWLLDEPIVHDSLSIVDDTLHENAEFQYKSGLKTCVIRDPEPDCCDWCAERAGTYYYPDVPDSVWERHNNCLCEIGIETEKDSTNIETNYRRLPFPQSGDNIGIELRKKTPGQREIEVAIKEQINYRGKGNLVADAIVKNHYDLKYISPETMYNLLEEAGFKPIPLAKSEHGFNDLSLSEGGGYIASLGNDGGTIEYHPEGGRHGINYYRVSSGQTRKHWYDTDGKEFIIGRGGKPQYIDL